LFFYIFSKNSRTRKLMKFRD